MPPMWSLVSMPVDHLRRRVVREAEGLFSHADDPLADTLLYAGDPGLFGPGSITWELMGDASTFIGGIRALLVQAAHPEVVAGVADHSRYREDPLGRLSRTSNYVAATSYGAMPEVEAAVGAVRRAHVRVRGTSHRGIPYTAADPELAAWVHNSLTDSFLVAARVFGPRSLSIEEADRFVTEQARVGRLLGADPLPETAAELARWVAQHPAVARSPGMVEAVGFLRQPPLSPAVLLELSTDGGGCRCHAPRAVAGGPGHPRPPGRRPHWPGVHAVTPVVPRLLPAMAGSAPSRGRAHPGGAVQAEDAVRDDPAPASMIVGRPRRRGRLVVPARSTPDPDRAPVRTRVDARRVERATRTDCPGRQRVGMT